MRSTWARWPWPMRPRSRVGERRPDGRRASFEQIDAVEPAAGAHIAVLAARGAAPVLVGAFDVHRAGPVLGSFGGLERTVLPLRFPVLDVHLFDRAVEVLDLDGAVVIIEGDYLEQRAAVQA